MKARDVKVGDLIGDGRKVAMVRLLRNGWLVEITWRHASSDEYGGRLMLFAEETVPA